MSSKTLHLTLFQKALILVAVPLTFELCLLGTVTVLLYQAENEARQADHSKAVIAKTTEVIQLLFDVGYAFVAYDAKTNEILGDRLNQELAETPKQLKALEELVRSEPAHLTIVQSVASETEEDFQLVKSRKKVIEDGGHLDLMEAFNMRQDLNEMVAKLDSMIKDERAQQADPEAVSRLNSIIKMSLFGGVLTSILLAALLVMKFHQSTTRRLKVLMENSVRIGTGAGLVDSLKGDDELGQLDRVLHNTAETLAVLERERLEVERVKQQFVSMISHDLRTPLSAVKSTLELLGAGALGALSEKAQLKVTRAEDNLRHTMDLINNLLDLEKMESGRMELDLKHTELQPILDRCTEAVSALADRKAILVKSAQTQAAVMADERRLSQLIINLLGNAIKFSPEKSEIDIEIKSTKSMTKISIIDQGPGIPTAQKDLIFDRYHQTGTDEAARVEGTGLGLAICKAIAEGHNGSIGVDSLEGKGSTFWFSVPTSS
ncbi:MAG: HAMP domain-containing histidine kinase [Cyanobacteria bacterium SZAS-4]|nr:HAMP domain-containing histidine kinase [Cyanobacteria bacterium SZAS-4]